MKLFKTEEDQAAFQQAIEDQEFGDIRSMLDEHQWPVESEEVKQAILNQLNVEFKDNPNVFNYADKVACVFDYTEEDGWGYVEDLEGWNRKQDAA